MKKLIRYANEDLEIDTKTLEIKRLASKDFLTMCDSLLISGDKNKPLVKYPINNQTEASFKQ
jgi:hypothetical protein